MKPGPTAAAAELVECLNRQAEHFRHFLRLLARQHDAMIAHDTRELEGIVADQEEAIAASRRCEQHRRALTLRLADAPDQAEGSLNIQRIRELVAASDASRLDRALETLAELQKEISRRQKLNQSLIEQSLRCTDEVPPWTAHWAGVKTLYGPPPKPPGGTDPPIDRPGL